MRDAPNDDRPMSVEPRVNTGVGRCPHCRKRLPFFRAYGLLPSFACEECGAILRLRRRSVFWIGGGVLGAHVAGRITVSHGFSSGVSYGVTLATAIAYFLLLGCVRTFDTIRAPPARHCPTCGYNLTGLNSERCPECGTAESARSPSPEGNADMPRPAQR